MSKETETKEELAQKLTQVQQKEIQKCGEEINAVLDKYKMAFNINCFFDTEGKHRNNVGIVLRQQ